MPALPIPIQVSPAESGNYECRVRNSAGEASTSCNLRVFPKEPHRTDSPFAPETLLEAYSQRPRHQPPSVRRRYPEPDEIFEPSKAPRLTRDRSPSWEVPLVPSFVQRDRTPTSTAIFDSKRATSVPAFEREILPR